MRYLAVSESVDELGWGFKIRERPRLWHFLAGVLFSVGFLRVLLFADIFYPISFLFLVCVVVSVC